MVRSGLMEAQNLLEPERKIEIVREIERGENLHMADERSGEPPDDPGASRGEPRTTDPEGRGGRRNSRR